MCMRIMNYTLAKHSPATALWKRSSHSTAVRWWANGNVGTTANKTFCVQTNRIGGKVSVDCSMSPWTNFIWNTAGLLLGQEQKKRKTQDKTKVHQQNPMNKKQWSFVWPTGECPETEWLPSDCVLDNARHKSYPRLDKAINVPICTLWAFTFQFKDRKWAFMSQGYGGERLVSNGKVEQPGQRNNYISISFCLSINFRPTYSWPLSTI